MNNQVTKREIVSRVVDKLYADGKRIDNGDSKHGYKRKFRLKYTKVIVNDVIGAFWDVVAEILAEGDSVKLNECIKIEPKYCAERECKGKYVPAGKESVTVPEHYRPKFYALAKLQRACEQLTEKEFGSRTTATE